MYKSNFKIGDRVSVMGTVANVETCPVIQVTI